MTRDPGWNAMKLGDRRTEKHMKAVAPADAWLLGRWTMQHVRRGRIMFERRGTGPRAYWEVTDIERSDEKMTWRQLDKPFMGSGFTTSKLPIYHLEEDRGRNLIATHGRIQLVKEKWVWTAFIATEHFDTLIGTTYSLDDAKRKVETVLRVFRGAP